MTATHIPSGHFTDLTYGNGGMSRHQCGGCGSPIVSRLEAWVHALTGSAACPGNTDDARYWAKAAGTPEKETPVSVYECEDCGWLWPLATKPPEEAECDRCGGELAPARTGG